MSTGSYIGNIWTCIKFYKYLLSFFHSREYKLSAYDFYKALYQQFKIHYLRGSGPLVRANMATLWKCIKYIYIFTFINLRLLEIKYMYSYFVHYVLLDCEIIHCPCTEGLMFFLRGGGYTYGHVLNNVNMFGWMKFCEGWIVLSFLHRICSDERKNKYGGCRRERRFCI